MSAAVLEKSDAPVEAPVDKSVAHAMSRARPAARDVDATLRAAGASLVLDAIDAATEAELLDVVERNEWDRSLSRRVQHYGHRFAYPPTERREPVSADARGVGVVLFYGRSDASTNERRHEHPTPPTPLPEVHTSAGTRARRACRRRRLYPRRFYAWPTPSRRRAGRTNRCSARSTSTCPAKGSRRTSTRAPPARPTEPSKRAVWRAFLSVARACARTPRRSFGVRPVDLDFLRKLSTACSHPYLPG